jgi:hypothetical protein
MNKGYIVVEGHGEIEAVPKLIKTLWNDLALPTMNWHSPPMRSKGLSTKFGIEKACELLRSRKDCAAALLLRDADDDCPKQTAPTIAAWVASMNLSFPVAVVLPLREFEAWFLPCVQRMAGKRIREGLELRTSAQWNGDPETIRGAKEWLTKNLFPDNKAYKPSLDQVALTQLVDFSLLRSANVRSFGTLERALKFLAAPNGSNVYPPPVLPTEPPTITAKTRKR